ncbi:hypothetical protein KO481_40640 [Nocardia sp. NEAU-G5]|uniref:Uncharacterized protein n=1 Tax=Nocardia albiluteola TaxID=2842303 RepID=A0ABS6BBZ3_9NOCA|nr:hypothetical protein [Nocardia albiluteola]
MVVGDEHYNGSGADYDYAGSEVLNEIGIADICEPIRAVLIDRINHTAGGWYDYRIGHQIDAIGVLCISVASAVSTRCPGRALVSTPCVEAIVAVPGVGQSVRQRRRPMSPVAVVSNDKHFCSSTA